MKIIKRLLIENFRGIEKIEFPVNSINIIVGRNNTGKSSILQAISLILTSDDSFTDSLGNDMIEYLLDTKEYQLKFLVRNELKTKIQMDYQDEKLALEIIYSKEGLPNNDGLGYILNYIENLKEETIKKRASEELASFTISSRRIREALEKLSKEKRIEYEKSDNISLEKVIEDLSVTPITNEAESELKEYLDNEKLTFFLYGNNELSYINLIPGVFKKYGGRYRKIERNPPRLCTINVNEVFFKTHFDKYPDIPMIFDFEKVTLLDEVSEIHDIVIQRKKAFRAVDIIKEGVPYFEDIRKTDMGLFVLLKGEDHPLPLASMGDGFVSLLKLTFLITLAEEGILLFEEPEISQHPGFLDLFSENIILNSKTTQFFISTHNLDLINFILEHAKRKKKLGDINIIRLHAGIDNQVDLEIIDGISAKDEVDRIGTDLRGA